ncbi:GNAT family N-acetyltransferase [Nocardia testacea]|uniref:GNAT family N-acetyltransferase n=1 Tax=Nocardia testacea TaxID=248551 RepID=UPI0033CCA6C2
MPREAISVRSSARTRVSRRIGPRGGPRRLLAGWAFDALAVARLELTCGPDNLASQRVALRCGFVREGLLRSHIPYQGARRDTVVFGLLPGELT